MTTFTNKIQDKHPNQSTSLERQTQITRELHIIKYYEVDCRTC